MEKKDIVVVIPIYRTVLSRQEEVSLNQCVNILSEYSLVVIKPVNLNTDAIFTRYPMLQVQEFPEYCFSSLRAYNELVLEEIFYQHFSSYQYMLIYQLDAYVFKDELLDWSNKGFDYIGAPWIPYKKRYLSAIGRYRLLIQRFFYRLFDKETLKLNKYYAYQVGNGGLSLRRIDKMIDITSYYRGKITSKLANSDILYPEDVFLLLELNDKKHSLSKPSFKEALMFSMEENPEWAYQYNDRQLPFGCHAWCHKDYYHFWKTMIKV